MCFWNHNCWTFSFLCDIEWTPSVFLLSLIEKFFILRLLLLVFSFGISFRITFRVDTNRERRDEEIVSACQSSWCGKCFYFHISSVSPFPSYIETHPCILQVHPSILRPLPHHQRSHFIPLAKAKRDFSTTKTDIESLQIHSTEQDDPIRSIFYCKNTRDMYDFRRFKSFNQF